MAFGMDDEILQDFLVEAGDILEQLNEQLIDLEQDPGNYDLLNAVFRGFHTIKGGAGFLNIEAMVTVCHRAEDVFNILRQGQRQINPSLMDAVLQVLDLVNEMFVSVKAGKELEHAPQELIDTLTALSLPDDSATDEVPEPAELRDDPAISLVADSDEITEDEFERCWTNCMVRESMGVSLWRQRVIARKNLRQRKSGHPEPKQKQRQSRRQSPRPLPGQIKVLKKW